MENSNCPLCIFPQLETKCLLFSIKRQLRSLLNQYMPDFNQEDTKENKNQKSFVQMLKVIFGDKYFSNPLINKCNHEKICRYLKRKFKCDSKTFHQLCDQLSLKIGQKSFHFQVLTTQIKALGQASVKQWLNVQNKEKEKIRTKETIQSTQNLKNQVQNDREKGNADNQFYNNNQNNNKQINQGINLQLPYFYPFGIFYSSFQSPQHNRKED